ncbi:MAG: TlpA disulfide reductase family protein [Pseudomonadota bacterium]
MRLALFALLLLSSQAGAIAPGAAAPDFSLAGSSGQVSLADYRGKYVYLDFWASWCAPCKRSFPWMGELQKRYGPSGLQIVAINVDANRADADHFLAATPAAFSVAYDPAGITPRKYAIKGMPSSVLIDPQGQVLFVHAGFNDATAAEIEAQIKQAVQKKEKP